MRVLRQICVCCVRYACVASDMRVLRQTTNIRMPAVVITIVPNVYAAHVCICILHYMKYKWQKLLKCYRI